MGSFLASPPPTAPPSPALRPKECILQSVEAEDFLPPNGDHHISTGSTSQLFEQALKQINVDECAADGENAFFVADLSEVYRQHLRWMRELPRVVPFYAVKCNPDPYVLQMLASLGCGFDCASNGEIGSVLDLGIAPNRIIYANPCKAASFVRNAASQGVSLATFDNLDELDKMKRFHPRAKLVIRILTDDSKSVCQLGLKFGAPLKVVPQLLQRARQLELDVVGVSFHVGSGCYDPNSFRDAVFRARSVFDLARDYGFHFDLLDVGGGYDHDNFEMIASVLRESIDEHFADAEFAPGGSRCPAGGLRIIGEPGRYYVQRAFSLAANIIARRDGSDDASISSDAKVNDAAAQKPQVMYYQNDGVYGAFNCIMFDHQSVQPKVLTLGHSFCYRPDLAAPGIAKEQEGDLQTCSVWGPTCDSIDCVREVVQLPRGLQVSDWLVYENMGAYTICAASGFNGLRKSEVKYTFGEGADADMVRQLLQ
jgi:ornithine decarboxylase